MGVLRHYDHQLVDVLLEEVESLDRLPFRKGPLHVEQLYETDFLQESPDVLRTEVDLLQVDRLDVLVDWLELVPNVGTSGQRDFGESSDGEQGLDQLVLDDRVR